MRKEIDQLEYAFEDAKLEMEMRLRGSVMGMGLVIEDSEPIKQVNEAIERLDSIVLIESEDVAFEIFGNVIKVNPNCVPSMESTVMEQHVLRSFFSILLTNVLASLLGPSTFVDGLNVVSKLDECLDQMLMCKTKNEYLECVEKRSQQIVNNVLEAFQ